MKNKRDCINLKRASKVAGACSHMQNGEEMIVYNCFPQGKTKALTMSYDDGRDQDVRLVSIFNQYGIKGSFNLNYGLMHWEDRVNKDQVAELYKGHEVATHTATHPTISRCPLTEVAMEILEDRKGLESLTGNLVRGHAYPNGSYSEDIKDLFGKLGIAYGRVVESRADFELPPEPLEWHPTCHHKDPELMNKAKWLADFQKKQYLKLMYVWGHSYEFDNDNNWEVIEEFCRFIGGREDIWYASNIEIIDYMEVLKRLRFTADNNGVFNPSADSAWLQVSDGRIVEAKGGSFTSLI